MFFVLFFVFVVAAIVAVVPAHASLLSWSILKKKL